MGCLSTKSQDSALPPTTSQGKSLNHWEMINEYLRTLLMFYRQIDESNVETACAQFTAQIQQLYTSLGWVNASAHELSKEFKRKEKDNELTIDDYGEFYLRSLVFSQAANVTVENLIDTIAVINANSVTNLSKTGVKVINSIMRRPVIEEIPKFLGREPSRSLIHTVMLEFIRASPFVLEFTYLADYFAAIPLCEPVPESHCILFQEVLHSQVIAECFPYKGTTVNDFIDAADYMIQPNRLYYFDFPRKSATFGLTYQGRIFIHSDFSIEDNRLNCGGRLMTMLHECAHVAPRLRLPEYQWSERYSTEENVLIHIHGDKMIEITKQEGGEFFEMMVFGRCWKKLYTSSSKLLNDLSCWQQSREDFIAEFTAAQIAGEGSFEESIQVSKSGQSGIERGQCRLEQLRLLGVDI